MRDFREAMIKTGAELTEILGEKWLEKNLLEKYVKLATSANYLFRETFLFFVQVHDNGSLGFVDRINENEADQQSAFAGAAGPGSVAACAGAVTGHGR